MERQLDQQHNEEGRIPILREILDLKRLRLQLLMLENEQKEREKQKMRDALEHHFQHCKKK